MMWCQWGTASTSSRIWDGVGHQDLQARPAILSHLARCYHAALVNRSTRALLLAAGSVLVLAAPVLAALVLTGCGQRQDENAATPAASSPKRIAKPVDFDGDGISDWLVYRGGTWLHLGPPKGAAALPSIQTGPPDPSCIPAPADYDGDGKVDLSQKCGGAWHFYNADGSYAKGIWTGGGAGELPVPADYDGDGDADVVVFRAGAWQFYDSASGAAARSVWTGPGAGSHPIPMDYDGDGNADFSVYQKGAWTLFKDDGTPYRGIWTGGTEGDVPVPGNYHGLGREEVVIFRGGAWMFYDLDTQANTGGVWTGAAPSPGRPRQPAPLDLDGDGTLELTVYTGNAWSFFNDDGTLLKVVPIDGKPGDQPISRRQLP